MNFLKINGTQYYYDYTTIVLLKYYYKNNKNRPFINESLNYMNTTSAVFCFLLSCAVYFPCTISNYTMLYFLNGFVSSHQFSAFSSFLSFRLKSLPPVSVFFFPRSNYLPKQKSESFLILVDVHL